MASGAIVRHGIRVRGTVQGVGFRPTVARLAAAHGLAGSVRNDAAGVWIEVEGALESVERFPAVLRNQAPPLSRVDGMEVAVLPPRGESGFRVVASGAGTDTAACIPADAATCEACLAELFDPRDRRHRYPFINCTDCGPRFTIVRDVPYDRPRTTMAAFSLCAECLSEYEDPTSRRFHAEPNACPRCGPTLRLGDLRGEDALQTAIDLLAAGRIVAVKGIGGFSLAVDARKESAVAALRIRKRRPHKPFALMARDLGVVTSIAHVDPTEREALLSPARPIVLLEAAEALRRGAVARSVAPGLRELGVMLPYSPLHHLLLERLPLLVMTSGNLSEEPIAKDDADAEQRLASIADAILLHDREIHTRADDSVVRVVGRAAQPMRRARGMVPAPIPLGVAGPSVLAVGAELKSTVCVTRGVDAFVSQHIGDLENVETFTFFEETIGKLERLLGVRPRFVAHDLHPDYRSTRWAVASGLPRIAVQHHHAHVAACLAEHGRTGPAIGVAFDGTGCGPAGDLWGGEILVVDLLRFERFTHLRPLALAGGEAAIRQPWRIACAALLDAGEPLDLLERIGSRLEPVSRMIASGVNSPRASGAGRWFDAVASLCAVRDEISYEAQAAIELEALSDPGDVDAYPFAFEDVIDLRPTVRAIAAELRSGILASRVAARFHETLARAVLEAARRARDSRHLETVALSGGCFQNKRLTRRCDELLARDGFEVLVHRTVPPNDGGVSLGQAAIAQRTLQQGEHHVSGHSG
jgi:hydrogenase maturation protein HypF